MFIIAIIILILLLIKIVRMFLPLREKFESLIQDPLNYKGIFLMWDANTLDLIRDSYGNKGTRIEIQQKLSASTNQYINDIFKDSLINWVTPSGEVVRLRIEKLQVEDKIYIIGQEVFIEVDELIVGAGLLILNYFIWEKFLKNRIKNKFIYYAIIFIIVMNIVISGKHVPLKEEINIQSSSLGSVGAGVGLLSALTFFGLNIKDKIKKKKFFDYISTIAIAAILGLGSYVYINTRNLRLLRALNMVRSGFVIMTLTYMIGALTIIIPDLF